MRSRLAAEGKLPAMTRNDDAPKPFSPVQRARKLAAVLGTTSS